jgi:hypothetical protein
MIIMKKIRANIRVFLIVMLLCIQVVQIDNNEPSWKKKKKQQFYSASKQKICELVKKINLTI